MTQPQPCELNPGTACGTCTSLCLHDAVERFEREAIRGVCDTGRYRCPYYSWGSGPPLVFIHGLSESQRSFIPLSALLTGQFRCIAYDLPTGRGDGARLSTYQHADLVADLFALLDHLDIRQSYLFGSSFGSTVMLAALRTRPERLPRAIVQGGFARRPLAVAEALLAYVARYWPGSMRALPLRAAINRHAHHGAFALRQPEMWDYFVNLTGAAPIKTVARRAVLMHRLDLRPTLAEIRQPVLVVCGDGDPLVGRICEQELLQGLPNARRVEIGGCGHFPYFTHPEVLAEVVREFLTP